MSIRKDYSIDVLRLLENLKQTIERTKTIGSFAIGFDKSDITFKIEQIRASMPREMKDAASLARETERILTAAEEESAATLEQANRQAEQIISEAQAKADNIIQQAELQQAQMVAEAEILRIAKAQADEYRKAAEKDSREMRRGADHYALDVLTNLENLVGRVLTSVEKGRRELQAHDQAPTSAVVETQREKAKV